MRISISKVLSLILFLTLDFSAEAQELKRGYIITLQRDTIRGYVVSRVNAEMGVKVDFVSDGENKRMTTYRPSELLGFGFDQGRVFRRLSFDKNDVNFHDSIAFFVKRSVEGKVGLYVLEKLNSGKPDMFLINNESHIWVHLTEPEEKLSSDKNGNQFVSQSQGHLRLLQLVKGEAIQAKDAPRYKEKEIEKDILTYDRRFEKDYSVIHYRPQVVYSHTFTGGLPLISPYQPFYRLAYYVNRSVPESSMRTSFQMGIVYNKVRPGDREYHISFLPVGFNFHAGKGIIRPYLHVGAGIEIAHYGGKSSNYLNGQFITGFGLKVKVGKGFILAEMTPSLVYRSWIGNIGFTF